MPTCTASTTTNCVKTYNIFGSDPANIGEDLAMKAMFAKFPSPNTFSAVGDGLNFAGFNWNPASQFTGPFFLGRVDHKFDANNNLSGSFMWTKYDTSQGDFLNNRPSVFPGFPPLGEVFRTSQLLSVSYRRSFTPRLVNDFTTGFSRFRFFFSLMESNTQGGNVPPPYGQECFGTTSLRNVNTPFCNTPHTERAVSNMQFIDNLSYVHGAHTIRVGENIRMYRHNDQRGVPGGFNEALAGIERGGRLGGHLLERSSKSREAFRCQVAQAILSPVSGCPYQDRRQDRLCHRNLDTRRWT